MIVAAFEEGCAAVPRRSVEEKIFGVKANTRDARMPRAFYRVNCKHADECLRVFFMPASVTLAATARIIRDHCDWHGPYCWLHLAALCERLAPRDSRLRRLRNHPSSHATFLLCAFTGSTFFLFFFSTTFLIPFYYSSIFSHNSSF